jgi:fructosamine-3-kinase
MGSLPQSNEESDSWSSFFIKRRLQPQVQPAQNAGLLDSKSVKAFELLYKNLQDLLPEQEPALLHGDLWSGNLITNSDGGPCLIDPAVYYGNREVDLAMTRLFGGFSQEFYDAYHEAFPLPPNDFDRVDLYNLYPLLVHLNLFGSSYLPGIKATLRRFGE